MAAVDELTAAEAIEKIEIDFEPLPFVVDPLVSLRPGGPNARIEGQRTGHAAAGPAPPGSAGQARRVPRSGAEVDRGGVRRGRRRPAADGQDAPDEWSYGDLEAGFKKAALVLDETFVTPNTSHQTLEPRTAMAYWQNGKLYMHTCTQSTAQTVAGVARWVGIPTRGRRRHQRVHRRRLRQQDHRRDLADDSGAAVEEGERAGDDAHHREEEHYIGRARPGVHGRMKVGFAKDGRITALDMFVDQRQRSVRAPGRLQQHRRRSRRCCISRRRCGGAASRC